MEYFSGLNDITIYSKIRILEYIAGQKNLKDLSEAEGIMAIRILNERKKNPNFLPEEIKDAIPVL